MHNLQNAVSRMGAGGGFLDRPINLAEANALEGFLKNDASNYLYSATVSIADALQAIDKELFTWATVKLYYSCFYMARGILALSGRGLIYENNKPKTIFCRENESLVKFTAAKGTHKSIIKYYSDSFPRSKFNTQTINHVNPFLWMMKLREEANYASARFEDPTCPSHFKKIIEIGLNQAIKSYIYDANDTYWFLPEHAILAFPIEILKEILKDPNIDISTNTSQEIKDFLGSVCRSKNEKIIDYLKLVKLES